MHKEKNVQVSDTTMMPNELMPAKKFLFFFLFIFFCFVENATAQKIQYSSENVFTDYCDNMQLVCNVGGNHHLVTFIEKEEPVIFIFNSDLVYKGKIKMPIKFPERSEIRIIAFANFYYLYIHPHLSTRYLFYKIAGNGNITDMSDAFQNLLQSQSHYIKLGFQLIANQNEMWMVFHTSLVDLNKNTIVIVQTDSLLNVMFSHKVAYDFKREEEKLQQEILMFGRYLLVLKTAQGGTSLELMKVNLATGYTIRNTFYSSGYLYTQPSFTYNNADSTITLTSILTEPRATSTPRRYVFVSRLNKILIEEAPFSILKYQFAKNTNTNFLLVDGESKWMRLRVQREPSYYPVYETVPTIHQDFTMPDVNAPNADNANRLLASINPVRSYNNSYDPRQAIRFSLLDKNFKLISDSLVPNNKNKYTINPDQFTRFNVASKDYMLVSQHFYRKTNGILMVCNNDDGQLKYTNVRVNDLYDYQLSKSQIIPQQGVIIPYTRRREAGLLKITME